MSKSIGGDESNQVKYGYAILANGGNPEFTNGLPKPAEGTEVLDLKKWLDFHSGLREEEKAGEVTERIVEELGGTKGDMKSIQKALGIIEKQIEALSGATEKIKTAIEPASQHKPPPVINREKYPHHGNVYRTSREDKPGSSPNVPDTINYKDF